MVFDASKCSNPCFPRHFLLLPPGFFHHSTTTPHLYTHPPSFSYFPNIHHPLLLRVQIPAPSVPIISQTPSFHLSTYGLSLLSPASCYLVLPFQVKWDLIVLRQLRWQMGRDDLYCVVCLGVDRLSRFSSLFLVIVLFLEPDIRVVEESCEYERSQSCPERRGKNSIYVIADLVVLWAGGSWLRCSKLIICWRDKLSGWSNVTGRGSGVACGI